MKKFAFLIILILVATLPSYAGINVSEAASNPMVRGGVGVGTIIAIMASWTRNKSVLWAILHAFFGWFYVIYYVITR
jgi:hypothetical protein